MMLFCLTAKDVDCDLWHVLSCGAVLNLSYLSNRSCSELTISSEHQGLVHCL